MARTVTRRELLTGMAAIGVLFLPETARADTLVLVVGPGSKLGDITSTKLRRIFLMRPTESPNGGKFRPLNLPKGTTSRQWFDAKVLKMSPDEVNRYWIDQKIRGIQPPPTVEVEAAREILKQVPAAITYVPASATQGLRQVSIDGDPSWLD